MDGDPRMAIRCIMAPDQAEHLALKEYATFKLMQVIAERDAAIIERDNVLAEKKAAFNERDSAFLQRDIAFAERDAAMHERDNAMAALENARGLRGLGWNQFKRQPDMKGRDATLLQMSLPGGPFMVEEAQNIHSHPDPSMLGFINNNTEKIEPMQQSPQANSKSRKKDATKANKEKNTPVQAGSDGSKPERKRKRSNNSNGAPQEGSVPLILPVVPYLGQEEQQQVKDELQEYLPEQRDLSFVISTPIPYCSCTGIPQPCYRWGNGGWQSACCTNTLSMHPLPMNPMKRGYRLPGRKMSAGAFQKLVKRFTQEGVDLSQPIDLKDYWAKHGTNRYITIK